MKVTISGFYDEISFKLDNQLDALKELGETYMCPRTIDGKNIADYTAEEFAKTVQPKLDAAGIKFSSIGSPIGKVSITDDEGYQKQLVKLAELVKIAELMDCKYIRIFSFLLPSYDDPAMYRDEVMKKMRGYLDVVKGSKVILLHENEKGIYGNIATRCLDLYQTMDDPQLQLIYDASNFIQCDDDPVAAFELLKDYVVYYHIKDCDKETKVEVPVGTGDGNYDYILSELKKRGYEGFMTLEPHTAKYAVLRRPVYFIPFMPFILAKFYKAFRKIDATLGKKATQKVTRKDVFFIQYDYLNKLIKEEAN
ncbi:MAG: sugar phosphate isomerase/epimerase [Clostridia bacterium]|nr:sugar phosphate isomerase/epimerase [Clostridia bacterium]